MHFIYNTIIWLLTLLGLPILLPVILFSKRVRKGLGNRLGFYARSMRETVQDLPRPRVWIHAASLGEVTAIIPIARALKERNPDMGLVISTMTMTGLEHAKSKIQYASVFFIAPLDYPGVVKRVLRWIEPNLLVIAETELWPNLIRQAKRFGSQVALINARLSERSVRRYQWVRSLIKRTLDRFDLIAAQSSEDENRFIQLGANPQRMKVIGNIKFDAVAGGNVDKIRKDLRIEPGYPVWVAGSTRPGEEEIIINAFQQVQTKVPHAILVLALRHLERLPEVERLLVQQRMSFTYRSRVSQELLNFPVILLDTMGELADVYGLGRVAFVGGSLMPFGGHNPLEPAALGVPVLVGPHTEHFTEVMQMLLAKDGAKVVSTADELARAVVEMLCQPDQAKAIGIRARQVVSDYQGTASQTVELLQKLMLIKRWAGEVKNWRVESLQHQTYTTSQEKLPDDWPEW